MWLVAVLVLAGVLWLPPVAAWQIEADVINVPAGAVLNHNFRQTYATPPVVLLLPDDTDPTPSALRIVSVSTTGFSVVQVRPPPPTAPAPTPVTVHYVAVEPGLHPLPGGGFLHAGLHTTSTVQKKFGGAEGFDIIGFGPFPGTVALAATLQTMNNEVHVPGTPSTPFMTVAAQNVVASSAQIAIELSEVPAPLPLGSSETIGWLAMQAGFTGSFQDSVLNTIDFEAIGVPDSVTHNCFNVPFAGAHPNPLVVGIKNRHDGGDGGWLRRCTLAAASVGVRVDEDATTDAERLHTTESAGLIVFSEPFDADLPDSTAGANPSWKLESDIVSLPAVSAGSTAFQSVLFRQIYEQPPLVFVLPDFSNPQPGAVRIRNVTTTGFEVVQVEPPPEDGDQPASTVHYVAMDAGFNQFPDGTLVDSGTIDTQATVFGGGVGGSFGTDNVAFNPGFLAAPAVIAEIQTLANESASLPGQPSVPWITAHTQSVTSTDMQVALERAESGSGAVSVDETVAYAAVEAGVITDFVDNAGNTILAEATRSAVVINGVDDAPGCFTVPFAQVYPAPPLVAATKNTRNGGNGGWLRRCLNSTNSVGLVTDEDQEGDAERSHLGTEAGSILVFSQPFDADFSVLAWYQMDEPAWVGPGSVLDASGRANHADPIGGVTTAQSNPAIPGSPGTCGYGVIPMNGTTGIRTAVDTGLVPQTRGTVAFWYNSNLDWVGTGNRMLLDASANLGGGGADKHFFLVKRNNGRLRFRFEDDTDANFTVQTLPNAFVANTWVHIAITWDLVAGQADVLINGAVAATSPIASSGVFGALNSLYVGDNRDAGIGGAGGYTGNSADGLIDEVRMFRRDLSPAEIAVLMTHTRTCSLALDHFSIAHDGNAINCDAEPVTVEAHLADHSIETAFTGTIDLTTSTGNGDWSVITAAGVLDNGTVGDGAATYTYAPADNGSVVLGLKDTVAETVNIDITDGSVSEDPSEDPDLVFAESGFVFLADGVKNTLGMQISAKPSNVAPGDQVLELQAVRTSDDTGACEPALVGPTTVELAFECVDPVVCTLSEVDVNGTDIAGNDAGPILTYTGVGLDFGDATDSTADLTISYPDAGQIQLHARYDIPLGDGSPSGNFMLGASNDFVVRPFGLDIDFSDDRASNGTGGPSFAADDNGSRFVKAGENFDTTVTAVLWEAVDDADTDGVPDTGADLSNNLPANNFGQETTPATVDVSHSLRSPAGQTPGTLSGGTGIGGFVAGAATVPMSWDEVGIIDLSATHSTYLGLATPDGDIEGTTTNLGRFYPARLALSDDPGSFRHGPDASWTCNFTYMDQVFTFSDPPANPEVIVSAQNLAGVTVQNYGGDTTAEDFWKFNPATPFAGRSYTDTSGSPLVLDVQTLLGSASVQADAADYDGSGTVAVIGDDFSYQRASAVEPVFSARATLNLTAADLVDEDGVCYTIVASSCNSIVDGDSGEGYTTGDIVGGEQRFGRLVAANVFGAETHDLNAPLNAEYFDGTSFVVNTDDNCTVLTLATDIDLFTPVDGLQNGDQSMTIGAGTTSVTSGNPSITAGVSNLTFSAPGSPNTGFVDYEADLTGAAMPWLRYDWDNDSVHDNHPRGRVSFGIHQGPRQIIYLREPWN